MHACRFQPLLAEVLAAPRETRDFIHLNSRGPGACCVASALCCLLGRSKDAPDCQGPTPRARCSQAAPHPCTQLHLAEAPRVRLPCGPTRRTLGCAAPGLADRQCLWRSDARRKLAVSCSTASRFSVVGAARMRSAITDLKVIDRRNSCSCFLRRPPSPWSEGAKDSSPGGMPTSSAAKLSSISSTSSPKPSSSTFSLKTGDKTCTHSGNGMSFRSCRFFLSGCTGRRGCPRWQKLQAMPLAHSPFAK
mmetsp:Transcript_85391/g.226719  ORF Transcript_85391/g.226719 Transcript_85391/m.226719 type:complete len:248 (-) Transcript_85391:1302-2045(-)